MKVINSQGLSPFGGLNFVHNEFDRLEIGKLLNKELPVLAAQSKYDWRDLLYSFWSIYFCGGDCIEDLSINLRQGLKQTPHLKIPSPDSILKRMKELASPSEFFDTPRGNKKHQFSIDESLNSLNIKLVKERVKKKEQIILDYDNTLIFSKKSDAKMTYKKQFGYAPGVGIIGDNIVYVENRNGNSDAQTLQQDTLERMFRVLESEGLKPDIFRADGASYQLSTISMIDKYANKLFVRARMSQALFRAIESVENWNEVHFEEQTILRGSTIFTPFESAAKRNNKKHLLKPYRLVISKEKRDDGQINLFTGEAFNYHAILTSDFEMSDDEVVCFYNQRGAIEKEFDILKNDFGWKNLPFSKIEQNTVFLIFTAICRNLYAHIIELFADRFKGLSPKYRIKKFIFRFITIPAKWVKQSRCWKLKIYGDLAFKT